MGSCVLNSINSKKAEIELKKNSKEEVKPDKAEMKVEVKPEKLLNNDQKKELQKIKTRIKQLEEQLLSLKNNKTRLENELANPEIYGNKQKFLQAESDYNAAVKSLSDKNTEYEKVFEQMMEMEEKIG